FYLLHENCLNSMQPLALYCWVYYTQDADCLHRSLLVHTLVRRPKLLKQWQTHGALNFEVIAAQGACQ
ncbi:unnamed protein product, partial [Callosobruchus maculatus]